MIVLYTTDFFVHLILISTGDLLYITLFTKEKKWIVPSIFSFYNNDYFFDKYIILILLFVQNSNNLNIFVELCKVSKKFLWILLFHTNGDHLVIPLFMIQ